MFIKYLYNCYGAAEIQGVMEQTMFCGIETVKQQ